MSRRKSRELLEKAGLIPLAVYDAYTKDAPKPDSGRLTFVAREHGKGIGKREIKEEIFLYE